jgi:hypothetical protein
VIRGAFILAIGFGLGYAKAFVESDDIGTLQEELAIVQMDIQRIKWAVVPPPEGEVLHSTDDPPEEPTIPDPETETSTEGESS